MVIYPKDGMYFFDEFIINFDTIKFYEKRKWYGDYIILITYNDNHTERLNFRDNRKARNRVLIKMRLTSGGAEKYKELPFLHNEYHDLEGRYLGD